MFRQQLYKSAEIFAGWILSVSNDPLHYQAYVLMADSLTRSYQYKRSLKFFESALYLAKRRHKAHVPDLVDRFTVACIHANEFYKAKDAVQFFYAATVGSKSITDSVNVGAALSDS